MAKYLSQFLIKIGGQAVTEEFMDDLEEVVVDTSLYLPDMFTLRLYDRGLSWVDDKLLDIGKVVDITVVTDEEQGEVRGTLIKGEITALEPHFSAAGDSTMLVRGYDRSHRLHRGCKTRTFLKKKDSEIASQLAREAGLTPQVDATTVTYDYVLQNNQTNMEFLLARAERIGYQVFAAEGKLYFKKGDFSLGDGPDLAYADGLRSFQPCWTASGQADKVTVKGWDAKGKKAVSSQKASNARLNQGGMTQPGSSTAKAVFSVAEAVVTNRPVFTSDEATALATGLSNDISREFVQAEGVCGGDPRVKAGWKVTIQKVGKRFSGKYFVTSATHIYSAEGYQTRFSMTGRQPNTLSHLLEPGGSNGHSRGLVEGVVTALVTNLNDPDNLGRVKVKYAWLGEIESDWLRIAAPMAGKERGFFYLPEVNDEVLIAFEHGDVHHPYIVGALWSSADKPPLPNNQATNNGVVDQRIIKSRSGHLVVLNDKDKEEQVVITSKSGHTVILDDKQGSESITIKDKTGKNAMVIDSAKNSMSINVEGDFSVTAKGKITLTSTRDLTLDTKAMGNLKSGGNMTVKATGNLSLQATGMGELKATSATVDGGPMTTIKGALVKIN